MLLKVDKSLRYNLTPERLNIGRPNQSSMCTCIPLPTQTKRNEKKAPPQKTTADV